MNVVLAGIGTGEQVSLRSVSQQVRILDDSQNYRSSKNGRDASALGLYPGAIYLHQGES